MVSLLVECSIRAFVIAAGVAAVLAAMRVKPAASRHAVWTGVLVAMLLLPAISLWGPKTVVRALPANFELPLPEMAEAPALGVRSGAAPVEAPRQIDGNTNVSWSWSQGAAAVYLLGFSLMLARLAIGMIQTQRLFKRAHAADGILYSEDCAAPVTAGLFHPKVFLPLFYRGWPQEKVNAALAHERQHVRRCDPLVRWLSLLNRCVFWFHPLAWWLERRLAALAEEVCDAAVLAHGHQAGEYAEYLLEMARAVERTGLRVDVYGSAMDGGALSRRIPRILAGGFAPSISRSRVAMAATLSAAVIVAVAACKLGRPQERAPGQPTMNELMHRKAEETKASAEKYRAFRDEARGLSVDQAKALEEKLKTDPADEKTREKLLLYYDFKSDFKARRQHALWAIEHAPESRLVFSGYLDPAQDRDGYERGKQLWLAHSERPGASVNVICRAAVFLSMADKPRAEEILLRGQKTSPEDQRWRFHLADLYYQALLGSEGPLPIGVIRSVNVAQAHGSYAQSVREKLDRSQDPDLLSAVGQRLVLRGRQKPLDIDGFALGKSYLERAAAQGRRMPTYVRKMEVRRKREISGADRLVTEMSTMDRDSYRDTDKAEVDARRVLDLAAEYPNDPLSGDAVFQAKMILGKVALRRGDKKTAAKYLLDAANTTESNDLKYEQIRMELPRSLVDWGEREAVAQFLERCAKVNVHGKQLTDWAAQIRRGINPDLIPMRTGCANEPC